MQPQKIARDLKFRIWEEEGLYYLCSENKGADQLCGFIAQLICGFVFAHAKSRVSHDVAHNGSNYKKYEYFFFAFCGL